MSEVLPLLFLPALAGWWFRERKRRAARPALRAVIDSGRSPMLADVGQASVIQVARSLQTTAVPAGNCPWWYSGHRRRAFEVQQLVAPLGLDLTEAMRERRSWFGRSAGFVGTSRFNGTRYGRETEVELGLSATTIRIRALAPLAAFAIAADATGALGATGAVPAALAAALETLVASRRWIGLELTAEDHAVTLQRPAGTPSSWLHDLWLSEFVADLAEPPQDLAIAPSHAEGATAPALALGT